VDPGGASAGSHQREASQEKNENDTQQLWKENDGEGRHALLSQNFF